MIAAGSNTARLASIAFFLIPSLAAAAPPMLGVGVVDSYVNPKGAFVNTIAPGSPAAVAKLVPSDVITAVDGRPVTSARDLNAAIGAHHAGDLVTLHVVHSGGGAAADMKIVLGEVPPGSDTAPLEIAKIPDAALPATPRGPVSPAGPRTAQAANVPAVARPGQSQNQNQNRRPDIVWVRFADPVEHAFTIDVPQGWRVTGGTRRMNAVDIRAGVEAISPDGAIRLFYSDPEIPIFTVPSRMTAFAGLRPGMTYNPGQGVQMLIEPYMNGEAFAAQWGMKTVGRDCAGPTRTGTKSRPDLSRAIGMAYAQGGIRTSIQAGEADFSCTIQGQPGAGYVFAATELVQASASALWDVKTFVGFSAPKTRATGAYGLLTHMVASFAIDPAWQARQNTLTAQFNRIVAETNAAVSRAIIANGKALSDASDRIFQAGQARSNATTNAIDKFDEYGVRGTSDFTNPETGTTYGNLDNSYAHTYVNAAQEIRQTDSETAPGPGWQEIHQNR